MCLPLVVCNHHRVYVCMCMWWCALNESWPTQAETVDPPHPAEHEPSESAMEGQDMNVRAWNLHIMSCDQITRRIPGPGKHLCAMWRVRRWGHPGSFFFPPAKVKVFDNVHALWSDDIKTALTWTWSWLIIWLYRHKNVYMWYGPSWVRSVPFRCHDILKK